MKQTTLIDVTKCTNIKQLVKFTLLQKTTDGQTLLDYIKRLFVGKCKLDLARRVMYEYGAYLYAHKQMIMLSVCVMMYPWIRLSQESSLQSACKKAVQIISNVCRKCAVG